MKTAATLTVETVDRRVDSVYSFGLETSGTLLVTNVNTSNRGQAVLLVPGGTPSVAIRDVGAVHTVLLTT